MSILVAAPAAAVPLERGTAAFRFGPRGAALPIRGGAIEAGRGELRLGGRLVLGRGRGRVVMRELVVDVDPEGVVTALVGGVRRIVLEVDTTRVRVGDDPTRVRVRGIRLRSTGPLARFGKRGVLDLSAAPRFVRVTGGGTRLALDAAFGELLAANGIELTPTEDATATEGGILLPISGGRLYRGRRGRSAIRHDGGLAFTRGDRTLQLRRLGLDLGSGVVRTLVAVAGPTTQDGDAPLLGADAPSVAARRRAASISRVQLRLTQAGAITLDELFDIDVFDARMTVGELEATARLG